MVSIKDPNDMFWAIGTAIRSGRKSSARKSNSLAHHGVTRLVPGNETRSQLFSCGKAFTHEPMLANSCYERDRTAHGHSVPTRPTLPVLLSGLPRPRSFRLRTEGHSLHSIALLALCRTPHPTHRQQQGVILHWEAPNFFVLRENAWQLAELVLGSSTDGSEIVAHVEAPDLMALLVALLKSRRDTGFV